MNIEIIDKMELESVAIAIDDAGFNVGALRVRQALQEITQLRLALDALVSVVGLTAIKHETQREVLQEAVDLAIDVLRS